MNTGDVAWEERGLRDAVLAGDAAAWSVLYGRSFRSLHGHVHQRAGGRQERVEEVVEETWMVAVRRLRQFDPARGTFDGWLRGIADNVLRNCRRRWQRREPVVAAAGEPVAHAGAAASLETAEEVARAMSMLPARYQDVLRAKYQEERTVAEIASRLGESGKAVESLLTRARAAFRTEYERLGKESSL